MPQSDRLRVLAAPALTSADGNPYITSLYDAVRREGIVVDHLTRRRLLDRYDVVHVHWPESLVRWGSRRQAAADVAKVLTSLAVARARGARLVWTGHNLGPHDMPQPALYGAFIRAFSAMTDGLISLGDSGTDALRERYPALRGTPTWVVPHGHYRDDYPDPPSRESARARLGLPAEPPVLLLLGQIRRYKNVPDLIEAFHGTTAGTAHLAVVGEVRGDPSLAEEIGTLVAGSSAVTARLERVPTADVPVWHAAADVVVLPYSLSTTLHSGAALLALSMGRPVVVPDSGTMRELQAVAGPEWVRTFTGGPREAVAAAMGIAGEERGELDLSSLDWSRLGRMTADVYRELARRR